MKDKLSITVVALAMMVAPFAANAQVIVDIDRADLGATGSLADVQIAPELLFDGVRAFTDRDHVYRNVPETLLGAEYIMMPNGDKVDPDHELHVTIGAAGTLYLILDSRIGTGRNDTTTAPDPAAAGMLWVGQAGFVDTGMKMGLDEHGDGSVNTHYGVFAKSVSPGVVILGAQNDTSTGSAYERNMYGVAATASRKATNPAPADGGTGDPSLMGWWKLDGLSSGAVPDSSGWGRHGVAYGQPLWVSGCAGLALQVDGVDDYVDTNYREDLSQWTVTVWVTSPRAPAQADVGGPVHRESNYQFNWDHDNSRFQGTAAVRIGDTWHPASFGVLSANQWHHLAATFDGASLNAYVNGELITANPEAQGVPFPESATLKIGRHAGGPWFFTGSIDDVRVYNRALSQGEIEDIVLYDPLLAQDPQPAHRGAIDIHDVNDLSWSAGEAAVMHDVYLGTDANAVEVADVNSPVYWGRQAETAFSLAELVESPGRYFWRIDEVQADGATVHKGVVWMFTVSGSVVIDDFQSYTDDEGSRIEETWIDGAVNSTGSEVGCWTDSSTRRGSPFSGNQRMSMVYDNAAAPFYSEVSRVFSPPQDWTACMADALSLLIRGDVVTFEEYPPGMFTLTAVGDDIWSNNDQFRYAFKRLDGNGSIAVKIVSLAYTHEWAKCGVMIRESLARDSAHAAMYVTPDGRRALQTRPTNGTGVCLTAHSPVRTISTPYWVKLERRDDQFTAYHSADGVNWIQQPDNEEVTSYQATNPTTIYMPTTIHIGLALCSHTNGAVATAVFSDIETTGYVSGQWQMAEIGYDHPGNSPDDLYVVVEDSNGVSATVVHPDPRAVNVTQWTPWRVPLTDFAGVDLTRVGKVSIGVGGREGLVTPGDGQLDIDDLMLWKP